MIHFDVLTLFPGMLHSPLDDSILKRAQERGQLSVALHNIRDFATDKHHVTDDAPYGGGGGMIMKVEPLACAVESVVAGELGIPVVLLSPQGRTFTQAVARDLSQHPRILLICGRYEGVDERVRQYVATDEISIGDYVLTGGELAALVIIDAVTRLLPGVLGDPAATAVDSYAQGLLEGPHYTRPAEFRGWRTPGVLLSGDHAAVARWRRDQALRRTLKRRPDLLATAQLSERDQEHLASLRAEQSPDEA